MHSFSRSLLGLGALTLAGCGAPAELDESRFPGVNDTGYTDTFSPLGAAGRGAAPASNAGAPGTSGSGNVAAGGSGSVGQGGSAPVAAAGGNGSVSAGGSPPVAQGGSPSGGGGEPTGGGNCPDDITVLFARPGAQGGCDGDACHSPLKQTPDMVSPGLEARLLNIPSRCMSIPYIGAGESFLEEKLEGDPRCGFAMPFGGSMTPEDKQCVLEWIDEVSGG